MRSIKIAMCQPLPESTELHDSRTRSTMFVGKRTGKRCVSRVMEPRRRARYGIPSPMEGRGYGYHFATPGFIFSFGIYQAVCWLASSGRQRLSARLPSSGMAGRLERWRCSHAAAPILLKIIEIPGRVEGCEKQAAAGGHGRIFGRDKFQEH